MEAHFDVGAKKNCYALGWSFGEICVGCGCCSDDPVERALARIKYHEWELEQAQVLSLWDDNDPDMREIQRKNVALDIAYNKRKIEEYKEELRRLQHGES